MTKNTITILILFVVTTRVFCKEDEIRTKWSSSDFVGTKSSRVFNPFSINYWYSIPSQVMQYWFPLFQSAYYPSYLKEHSTPKPQNSGQSETEKAVENSTKPKTNNNIFGMSDSGGDDIKCLPEASEIEWF